MMAMVMLFHDIDTEGDYHADGDDFNDDAVDDAVDDICEYHGDDDVDDNGKRLS